MSTPYVCHHDCDYCVNMICTERNVGNTTSITNEESKLIERELQYRDIIEHLKMARLIVGGDKSIDETIKRLSNLTRFTS